MTRWSLLLISDLHYDAQQIRDPQRFDLNRIASVANLEVVVSAGDLTDHGWGKSLCFRKQDDEFTPFIENFVNPLEKMGLRILLCGGNHDTYVKFPYIHKPVLQYIKEKYNSTYYHFDHNKSNCYKREIHGITFISMGVYPKNLKWLSENLPNDKSSPVIIFFHYNFLDDEAHSGWWKEIEKQEFYNVIKDHNISGIMHGHIHTTSVKKWNGIPVFNGSSPNTPLLIKFEDDKIVDTDTLN